MHDAQFDITSGEPLSGPVPANLGDEVIPEAIDKILQPVGILMSQINMCDLKSYSVEVNEDLIKIDV